MFNVQLIRTAERYDQIDSSKIRWLKDFKTKELEDSVAAPSERDLFPPLNMSRKDDPDVIEDQWDPMSMPTIPPIDMYSSWSMGMKAEVKAALANKPRHRTVPMDIVQSEADRILATVPVLIDQPVPPERGRGRPDDETPEGLSPRSMAESDG